MDFKRSDLTRKRPIRPAAAVFCAAVFGLILLSPPEASLQVTRPAMPGPVDLPGGESVKDVMNPKMDYALAKLYEIYRVEGAEKAIAFAERRSIDLDANGVCVVAESEVGSAALRLIPEALIVKSSIRALGGRIETTHRNLVQSRLPIPALEALSLSSAVKYVRLPLTAAPQAEIISEGVALTGADLWQSLTAYRNTGGAKIAVLDAGFIGYQSLLGSELPASVTAKSFRADGDLSAHVHGTACAEIVHDMAPNAQLWLVNSSTYPEFLNAVDYLVDEGVKIISYSMGWWNAGDGRGTGPVCAAVDYAAENGVLWSNSSGNDAERHWEGTFTDSDNDGWLDFSDGDEILSWWVPAFTSTGAYVNWDDWGTWTGSDYSGSGQDYDITLYYYANGIWNVAAESQNMQSGFQWPVEQAGDQFATFGTWWGIGIKKSSATRNCRLEIFAYGNSGPVEYNVASGSLLIPSDSPSAIAVGASDWRDSSFHSYSSQGPTHDGRIKPDFSAPSGVSTSTYGLGSEIRRSGARALAPAAFYGTSASAPCLAGALALLLEKTPYSASRIVKILGARAIDLGEAGEDNKFGRYGRLSLKNK